MRSTRLRSLAIATTPAHSLEPPDRTTRPHNAQVVVIGAGCVGLTTAACLAHLSYRVHCLELDQNRLESLLRGELPIEEEGLSELVKSAVESGLLRFSSNHAEAISSAEFVFIAVNAPPCDDGSLYTVDVLIAADQVAKYAPPDAVLVTRTTVPVGTGDLIAEQLQRCGRSDIEVTANPEFFSLGEAIEGFLKPDRIVIGAQSRRAADRVASIYRGIDVPLVVCSRRSAEMAKLASNAFLATRVSFTNELASLCDDTEAEIDRVTEIMALDTRIGPSHLGAGLGWGGSCFPKDLAALIALGEVSLCEVPILKAVAYVNQRQRSRVVSELRAAAPRGEQPIVAVFGITFKPGTNDVRGSPSVDIIKRLIADSVRVRAHDPVALTAGRQILGNAVVCEDPYTAVAGAHAILLATNWKMYESLDWARVRSQMRGRLVFDGRNVLDKCRLEALGFEYRAFGRNGSDYSVPEPFLASGQLATELEMSTGRPDRDDS